MCVSLGHCPLRNGGYVVISSNEPALSEAEWVEKFLLRRLGITLPCN